VMEFADKHERCQWVSHFIPLHTILCHFGYLVKNGEQFKNIKKAQQTLGFFVLFLFQCG
jgi:hypothetical protein